MGRGLARDTSEAAVASRQSSKPWAGGRWRADAREPVGLLLGKVCDGVQRRRWGSWQPGVGDLDLRDGGRDPRLGRSGGLGEEQWVSSFAMKRQPGGRGGQPGGPWPGA